MELKVLTLADREIITELFLSVFTFEPWNDDWSDEKQLEAYISDLVGNANSLALGFFDEGRLIALSMGNIRHWYRGTEYYIDEFCVDRGRQRQGVGSAFIMQIEQYLAGRGIHHIFLQTERTVPAYLFYKSRNFVELPDHISFGKKI